MASGLKTAPARAAARDNIAASARDISLAEIKKTMEASVAGSGGKVQFTRRNLDTGQMIPSHDPDAEMAAAEVGVKLKAAAEAIQHLSYDEKQAWVIDRKDEGNTLYREGKFQEAAEIYVESLVGLDFGSTPEHKRATVDKCQAPILCNLAACEIELGNWRKAVALTTEALKVQPGSVRALLRRCRAHGEGGNIGLARTDLATLIGMHDELTDAERKAVGVQRRRLVPQAKKAKASARKTKKMSEQFVKGGGIYGEKSGPMKFDESVDDDDDDTAGGAAGSAWACSRLRGWASWIAGQLGCGSGKHRGRAAAKKDD